MTDLSDEENVYFEKSGITKRKQQYEDHNTWTSEQLKAEASREQSCASIKGDDVIIIDDSDQSITLSDDENTDEPKKEAQNSSASIKDEDVIIIDDSDHFYITLSDDENYINNEQFSENVSARSKDDNIEKNLESSKEESITSGKHVFTCSDSNNRPTQSASISKQNHFPLIKTNKNPLKTPTNISSSKLHHPTAESIISSPKNFTPMPGTALTKSKIPSDIVPSVRKTPTGNRLMCVGPNHSSKTLLKTSAPTGTRAVNSDSKVKRVMMPLSQQCVKKIPQSRPTEKTLPSKKYKNIISPIQCYIRGSPTTLPRTAHNKSEKNILERPTSGTRPVTTVKAPPKAIQKPNYDKQEHVESRLPVMGKKQTKIPRAIPKIKITGPDGGVIECPKSKGVLVPNNESPTVDDLETNDLPIQQAQGRIAVRVQKTVIPQ